MRLSASLSSIYQLIRVRSSWGVVWCRRGYATSRQGGRGGGREEATSHTREETVPLQALSYEAQATPPHSPPLLVLHGLFGQANNWRSLTRHTELRQHRTFHLLDLRNHGRSPHHPHMTYRLMAEDVLRYLDDKHIESADVLGHSMGGKVGMCLALFHPTRVQRLIVVDIAPVRYPRLEMHLELVKALLSLDMSQIHSRKQADAFLKDSIQDDAIRQFLLTNLHMERNRKTYGWRINLPAIASGIEALADFPETHSRFEGPSLFLAGSRSRHITTPRESSIYTLFPHATISTIPNAGHWVHVDAPEAMTQAVTKFLCPV